MARVVFQAVKVVGVDRHIFRTTIALFGEPIRPAGFSLTLKSGVWRSVLVSARRFPTFQGSPLLKVVQIRHCAISEEGGYRAITWALKGRSTRVLAGTRVDSTS